MKCSERLFWAVAPTEAIRFLTLDEIRRFQQRYTFTLYGPAYGPAHIPGAGVPTPDSKKNTFCCVHIPMELPG
jgi:hypothetical protein